MKTPKINVHNRQPNEPYVTEFLTDFVVETECEEYTPPPFPSLEVKEFVDKAFDMIIKDIDDAQPALEMAIKEEKKGMPFLGEAKPIFNEPFIIRNHMAICYIRNMTYVEKNGIKYPVVANMPLNELSKTLKYTYYSPWSFPSVSIFHPQHPCTANLSSYGVVKITGGYSIQQLKDAVTYYVGLILTEASKITNYNYVLDDIHFKLRFASNKLGGLVINTKKFRDFCRQNNIVFYHNPNKFNSTQIFPFRKTLPHVAAAIFDAGGVNIYGWTSIHEAKFVYDFLCQCLWKFLRDNVDFKGWASYNAARERKAKNVFSDALARKANKIKNWENKIRDLKRREVYKAWEMTHEYPLARTFLKKLIKYEEFKKQPKTKKRKRTISGSKFPQDFLEEYDKVTELTSYVDIVKAYLESNEEARQMIQRSVTLQDIDFNSQLQITKSKLIDLDRRSLETCPDALTDPKISIRDRLIRLNAIKKGIEKYKIINL